MKISLDGTDITADIQKQTNIPNLLGGVYPNEGTKWYNFMPIIANHAELKSFFSTGGLHKLEIVDETGTEFDARIILRLTYSARNS